MAERSRKVPEQAVVILLAWATLVACRVGARVLSVGTGARTFWVLTALTASVNAYWMFALPALASWRGYTRRFARPLAFTLLAFAAVAVLCTEPVWYAWMLSAFHGRPLAWMDAVVDRGNINLLVVALVYAIGWVSDGYADARARHRQRAELEAVLIDAELRALTLQLQPHFLFNTLQLAAESGYDDLDAAKSIVTDLESLLRRTFDFEDRSLVPVTDEIDFLQSYVAIQQRRFGARLAVTLDVAADTHDLSIPPLLLQPLVENSIQHGLSPRARAGRIDVRVTRTATHLCITVRDDGVGFRARSSDGREAGGLGLGLTRRRLRALFVDDHALSMTDAPGGGAVVSIELPARTGSGVLPRLASSSDSDDVASHSWSMRGTTRLALGAALIIANVTGAALWLDGSGTLRPPSEPGTLAVWFPVEVVAFAVAIVLWRGRAVHRWLHERDAETHALRTQVATARARVGALRAGRDMMLSALARLRLAATPTEFDRLILATSDLVRGLLSASEDGHSSVELEANLANRYLAVLARDPIAGAAAPAEMDIALDASHALMPGGSLVSIMTSLITPAHGHVGPLSVRANMAREWLSLRVHMECEPVRDASLLQQIAEDLQRVEERVRHASSLDCHFRAEATDTGYEAVARFRSPPIDTRVFALGAA